jgi:OOP family OmpA-OmpF porin
MMKGLVIIALAAVALPGWAGAQEMSREEIKRSLSEQVLGERTADMPVKRGARTSRTRSVGVQPGSAPGAPAGWPAPSANPVAARPLAFRQIQFDFGSADLTFASRPTLDVLADAIADAMGDPAFRGVVFPILGFTDAKGAADYNLLLSQRRAAAVVRYLVARGIPADRLVAIGRGEEDLVDPSRPEGAANRRVEVRVRL